ncbi:hypothetical protein [Novosphingobium sp. 9]|uniref:hypothetical protein n=1 Tax=Novosphingobium sp. 9 TaxID=2025349 RepID=UPI0021B5F355|nr:hypothetical protein [Novosphingobium sp. 9]
MRHSIPTCLLSCLAIASAIPVIAMAQIPAPAPAQSSAGAPASALHRPAPEATRVLDQASAEKLLRNTGLTLQWIDWNTRGSAVITRVGTPKGDEWRLRGAQAQAGGPGRLFLDGTITEIGKDYFTFKGLISIDSTPDKGRRCTKDKTWRFAITQNRPYYRLRDFEWCDDLTDYIDIHV